MNEAREANVLITKRAFIECIYWNMKHQYNNKPASRCLLSNGTLISRKSYGNDDTSKKKAVQGS